MFLALKHEDVLLIASGPDKAGSWAAAEPPCATLGALLASAGNALVKIPVLGITRGDARDPPASSCIPSRHGGGELQLRG